MDCRDSRHNGAVLDRHMARELNDIRENDVVAHLTIVAEMNVGHQQTVLANGGLEGMRGTAIDRRVLTDDGTIADFDRCLLPGVLQILRRAAKNAADPDFYSLAKKDVAL